MDDESQNSNQDSTDTSQSGTGGLEAFGEELKRVGAAERGRGVTAGKREILGKLGFGTTDEAVAWVQAQRASTTDASETQKQLAAAQAEVAQLRGQVKAMGMQGAVTNALLGAGVRPDRVAAATQLLMSEPDVANSPDGSPTQEALSSIVGTFKGQYAEWFGPVQQQNEGDTQGGGNGASGNGSPIPPPAYVPLVQGAGEQATQGTGTASPQPGASGDAWFEHMYGKEVDKRRDSAARRAAQRARYEI